MEMCVWNKRQGRNEQKSLSGEEPSWGERCARQGRTEKQRRLFKIPQWAKICMPMPRHLFLFLFPSPFTRLVFTLGGIFDVSGYHRYNSLSSETTYINTGRQIPNFSSIEKRKREEREKTALDMSTSYNKVADRQRKGELIQRKRTKEKASVWQVWSLLSHSIAFKVRLKSGQ